jgi:hypothetical protein
MKSSKNLGTPGCMIVLAKHFLWWVEARALRGRAGSHGDSGLDLLAFDYHERNQRQEANCVKLDMLAGVGLHVNIDQSVKRL